MAGFSQGHQRALLPAAELPLAPTPRIVLPRYPRAGVTTACETCRKRKTRCSGNRPRCKGCIRAGSDCSYAPMNKDHELRQRYEHLQTEKIEYKRLVDLLRLRDHKEANAILDMLRQNTSVHEVLRQVEHGDMLCELFLVSEDSHSQSSRSKTISIDPPSVSFYSETTTNSSLGSIRSYKISDCSALTTSRSCIRLDMSHYDHEENLAKTAALTELCHERGIAVEAESGRINGGEDGIADTGDLEALFTTPNEIEDFVKAGIDILAPSVGNIHGDYGPKGPEPDLAMLSSIDQQIRGRAVMALHGTNDFTAEIMQDCIKAGPVKLNVNKLLLEVLHVHLKDNSHKPFMQRVDEGIEILQAEVERWIEICGSAGKA
ncbi:tagatose 1,6-diphosphate aldolase [Fusarium circinatum]|uniref:Fructose-bisphosphate aldolase n=1 Tax=Fusarium circinatum TaxID=48490 RepID=A0A8H5X382_FUSCI|nr:tagatose 1,6-diphosphate aldolase [Fusarium circinatum]